MIILWSIKDLNTLKTRCNIDYDGKIGVLYDEIIKATKKLALTALEVIEDEEEKDVTKEEFASAMMNIATQAIDEFNRDKKGGEADETQRLERDSE